MSGYIHFTDEQKQRANSVDLVDFLRRQGEQLIRSGREWRWKHHDSVTIRGNQWFRHSSRQGGLAIDFVQEFYGLSFPDAVTLLLNGEQGVLLRKSEREVPEQKKFRLPEAADNMRRIYAYLLKQRYIERDVLTYFVKEKKIFEDKEYHNVVFVGIDEKGVARHAHKRGTCSNTGSYRGNVEGSDPRYSFNHISAGDRIYVFEAPIDMLSYITLYQKDWQRHSYVTLNGVAEHAMLQMLSQNKQLSNVILCLDHDMAGIEAACRLTEILQEKGYKRSSCLQSVFKDWNEDLKAKHSVTPIPAQEHPKIEACRDLCREICNLCSNVKFIGSPHEMLKEHYEKFSSLIKSEKVMYSRNPVLMKHLQSMTVYALLAVQEQYHHFEKPMAIEQLSKQLFESYQPHQDKGKMRAKLDNIKQDIITIDDQFHEAGVRTLADNQKVVSSYMSFALNCIRAHIFIDLESQKQKTEVQQKQNANQLECEQEVCEEPAQHQYNLL